MEKHPNWQEETDHLRFIRDMIKTLLAAKIEEVSQLTTEEAGINRDMWEEIGNFHDMEGVSEFMQYIGQLKQNMSMARFNRREIERLDRLFLSPYFARIDFGAAGIPPEPCYIGITTLMDDDTARLLIHDWRAPISSLFYDWEPGDVSFESPSGTIHGRMSLKRQYRLEGGQLVLMFDAGLAIHDEMLQDILAGATGGHMRQIVSTIQKEQNRAIRFEDTRVLAVQGAAGSGKTAIAMHRAAYLLYRHRQTIKPENLVILSPNTLLGEYVADVLPELGEERIAGIPFGAIAADVPGLSGYDLETAAEQMETVLSHSDPLLLARMAQKTSPEFLALLESFVSQLSTHYAFPDLLFEDQVVVSGKDLTALYTEDFRHMGIGRRLERIRLRTQETLNSLEKGRMAKKAEDLESDDPHLGHREARALGRTSARQEFQRLHQELDRLTLLQPIELYRQLLTIALEPQDAEATLQSLAGGRVPYEDLAPIMFVSLACSLHEPDTKVRHVLVDEAQDFTRIQYAALRMMYPRAGFTLLGDENQNIQTESAIGSLEKAAEILDAKSHACIRLDRTYRCTLPISRLADEFRLIPSSVNHFGRAGLLPNLMLANGTNALPHHLAQHLKSAAERGHHTVAVLTRTMIGAHQLFAAWRESDHAAEWEDRFPAKSVSENFTQGLDGLLFLPVWLAKGLEFEEVVLLFEDRDAYSAVNEKGLLHTACTRALHHLALLSADGIPTVLAPVPENLYTQDTSHIHRRVP